MTKVINLFENGAVEKDNRKFTRLVGGFNEESSILTTKQIGKLLNLDNRVVNQTINRNIKSFTENVDIIDLKLAVTESDSELLSNIEYTHNAYNASKNVYILSKSGFLVYLKFAEGDKALGVYKDFLEDYFKTKAENESMKQSIEQTLIQLKEEKAMMLGKAIMAKSDIERIEFMQLSEAKNEQIIQLEKSISEQHIVEKLSSKLHMSELIENSKSNYDISKFTKILDVKGLGRNKMFEWLRENKLLMNDNVPYQQYAQYFSVIPVVNDKGYTNFKTLLKPKGIDYVMKRLIKDGKVITKSIDDVLSELEVIA